MGDDLMAGESYHGELKRIAEALEALVKQGATPRVSPMHKPMPMVIDPGFTRPDPALKITV